jgi:hypothetical protein
VGRKWFRPESEEEKMQDNVEENSASRSTNDANSCPRSAEAHAPVPAAPQVSTNAVVKAADQRANIELPDEVIRRLRKRLGVMYECWFANVKVMNVDNKHGRLTLSATGNFVRDWMQSHYESHVLDAWNAARRTVGGPRMTRVEFRTVSHGPNP